MSGMSTKKFLRELVRLSGADKAVTLRRNKHQVVEFRRKGATRGFVYTVPVSASCHHALGLCAKDVRKGLDAMAPANA